MNINGIEFDFTGRHISQYGPIILNTSSSKDGKNIVLRLNEDEESYIELCNPSNDMGYYLFNLISDALIARGIDCKGLNYSYSDSTFTTS